MGSFAHIKEAAKQRLDWKIAVFAAGAGLVGALVGGLVTLTGTVIQVNHDSAQAEADFLRGERQAAYSQILTDLHAVDDGETNWANSFYHEVHDHPGQPLSAETLDSAPLHGAMDKLAVDLANIEIIGSADGFSCRT